MSRTALIVASILAMHPTQIFAQDILEKSGNVYRKICSAYGAGFTDINQSGTCLNINGYVRADFYANAAPVFNPYITGQVDDARLDKFNSFARGMIHFDARTETEYGTLRAYIGLGAHIYGSKENVMVSHFLPRAFIQLAGFTAGYTQSFYDPVDATKTFLYTAPYTRSDRWTNLIAYTHEFGNGWSSSISLEDGWFRNEGIGPNVDAQTGLTALRGGNQLPDLVMNLRYEKEWGAFQVNGALHQVREVRIAGNNASASQVGWAFGGVLSLNVPVLSEKDQIYIMGSYADGAISYTGLSGNSSSPSPGILGQISSNGLSGAYYRTADVVWNGIDRYETSSAWSTSTQMRYYLTNNIRSSLYAGLVHVDMPDNPYAAAHGYLDVNLWQVGGNVAWFPVKQMEIGIEVMYSRVSGDAEFQPDGCTDVWTGTARSCGGSVGTLSGGIRFQRFF